MSFDPLRSSTGISEVTVDAMGAMVSEHCNRVTVAAPHSFRVMPVTTGAEVLSPAMSTVSTPVMVRPLASVPEHTMPLLSIFTVLLALMRWTPFAE